MKIYSLTNSIILILHYECSYFLYNFGQISDWLTHQEARITFFCGQSFLKQILNCGIAIYFGMEGTIIDKLTAQQPNGCNVLKKKTVVTAVARSKRVGKKLQSQVF